MRLLLFIMVGLSLLSCKQNEETQTEISEQEVSEPLFTASLGVQTYSYRNYFPKNMLETLDRIQDLGITEIEGGPERIPPEEFKRLCDERNIRIASTGASFDDLKNKPQEVASIANTMGAKYVMCAWAPHEKGKFSLKDADNAIEVFTKAGKILKEAGVTFCYHPHGYEFQTHGEGTLLDYMIQNTDPEYVSYEMDIFWIHFGGGDPTELLLKYPNRWKLMHLKDMKKGTPKDLTGGTDVNNDVPLGTGELDMPSILKAAKQVGVVHYFLEDESDNVLDQIPESIKYLQSLKS